MTSKNNRVARTERVIEWLDGLKPDSCLHAIEITKLAMQLEMVKFSLPDIKDQQSDRYLCLITFLTAIRACEVTNLNSTDVPVDCERLDRLFRTYVDHFTENRGKE